MRSCSCVMACSGVNTLQDACRLIETMIMEIFVRHGLWSTNRLSFCKHLFHSIVVIGICLNSVYKLDGVKYPFI
jgi:hypothetical protein